MFNSLNVNPNLIQNGTRDSYLDSGDKGTDKPKIILDLTKGVHPLLPIETLQEYNRLLWIGYYPSMGMNIWTYLLQGSMRI
jgi:hypothetical protein